jgi:hypothetical protein
MQDRRNKTFFWIFTTLAVTVLLLALALRPTRVGEMQAMTNRIVELKLESRSRKMPRSVLHVKLDPGNAWEEYDIALEDAQTWSEDDSGSIFSRFLAGDTKVDRAKVKQLVITHKEAIEHLRLGAQQSDGQYPYAWEKIPEMELPSLMGSRRLANVAVAQAKLWRENGRSQDAVDLLLDVSAFARDLSTNSTLLSDLIGFAVYEVTFAEFRELIQSGNLTQTQLADLAKKLAIVDHDFPTLSSAFSNETLAFGLATLKISGEGMRSRAQFGDWRFTIYPQPTMLNAFETKDALLKRMQTLDHMKFAAARKEADAISAEGEASPNTLVRAAMPGMSRMIVAHREPLARLRLVRAGTEFLSTGKMPVLADPFGDKLFYKQEGNKSRIWSIGRDGINQNGSGKWEAQPDIVLEINNPGTTVRK